MSEQSDIILTPSSYGDDLLKWELDRLLWGYPKLVDTCPFSVLADVRRKNLEEREKILGSLPAFTRNRLRMRREGNVRKYRAEET